MAEFKCIGCGEIKNMEKQCGCPICGYTMYAMPYNRSEKLKKEILRFIDLVINEPIEISEIYFKGKNEDVNRFPDFKKIQTFVCASGKTEQFYENLKKSLEKIKEHLHTDFHKKYTGSLKQLGEDSKNREEHLVEIMKEFGIEFTAEKLVLQPVSLYYSETPDENLIKLADEILSKCSILLEKIYKFIKANNIYGRVFRKVYPENSKNKKVSPEDRLNSVLNELEKIIAKKYVIDIFDDGNAELDNMLKTLWDAVCAVMSAPILEKKCIYTVGKTNDIAEKECLEILTRLIVDRFQNIAEKINDESFLTDKNEDQLFDLYNKMLDLDWYDVLKLNKGEFKIGTSEKNLKELIGLDSVKISVQKIKAYFLANKENLNLNLHMCFYGNPGTGKTEVARIIAGILYENGILPTSNVVETDRSGLIAGYVGQTAMKTMEKIEEAMGGVLFIDEAYSLIQGESKNDYGHEAVATLIKAMEDYRGRFCVILAGYKNPMEEMLSANPGFKSRIQFKLDFPNYSRDELKKITELMLKKRAYTIDESAFEKLLDITDVKRKEPNFANAREIRNILDQVVMCQNLRCIGSNDRELALVDVNTYIKDSKINLPTSGEGFSKKILTAEEELDNLIGLSLVKRMVKKIKAYAKRNKNDTDFNLHMCFYGNPGTGKTEVARILSRILYDAGILPEAKLTETDFHGLIGKYVGETAPKTLAKINDAMGGVLFIDEAYILANTSGSDDTSAGYGEEAIATLLKEMEDRRGQFYVILAGYKDEMKSMISTNPGLESRIQFALDFPDYTREELGEIALAFLKKKKYEIENDALELLLDITEYYRNRPNFANARTVRNILDQVIMNQNLRAEDDEEDRTIILSDVKDYIADENINLNETKKSGKIGF